ncbi:hypothetical protein [Mesonia aquimarina]|uniref:hypothetical protein n=1 Tax=Mesonia aquimarina TaxID=1504967 RepID=UPI000EF61A27|nr:hypothetical protein [Mesonia aquimarina]
MKKLKFITFLLVSLVFATACSSDDDSGNDNNTPTQENQFVFDGDTFPLKAGALEYYGNESGLHNTDIIFVTTEVDENEEPEDEIFNSIYFELFTTNENLETGDYSFFEGEAPNTFSDFSDISIASGTAENPTLKYYEIISGEITVVSKNPYEFIFEGEAVNWDDENDIVDFSGHYKGDMYEFDYSDEEGRPENNSDSKSVFKKK